MIHGLALSMCAAIVAVTGLARRVSAQAEPWRQCGGYSWTGDTACVEGHYCSKINPYWSMCLPDDAQTGTVSANPIATASQHSVSSSRTGPMTVRVRATATKSGTSPGSTLVSGWYWIRAVAPPNFHSYLQTKPTSLPSDSFLDAASNAGQFNVVDGQLVYNTGAGGELYMHVENPEDKTQRKLETWFSEEKSTYGDFGFQGDTLIWHADDIARPNEAAWLVCDDQQLFVNTGAYAYDSPAGCADQTIHYYNGATADV